MTKSLAPRSPANPRTLLARILDQPDLVSAVQALPPASLLRLIDRVGLEDAGELVALTTVDQLRRVFDEDVWRSGRPGEDERFDPARFTLWLNVMLEAGARFAADKLVELPEDLVELAFHHQILVISLEELALLISEGEGQVPLEKVIEDCPYLEFGDYCVIGRSHESWEAIATVLTALDEHHSNSLQPMLERLWRVTSDYVYGQGGLFDVLTSEEMLQSDAAAEREDRRESSGFVAPASARSFLTLARGDDVASLLGAPSRDPVTSAFFRHSEATPIAVTGAEGAAATEPQSANLEALIDEPTIAIDAAPPRLVGTGDEAEGGERNLLARALGALAASDTVRHVERIRELGYLANVLLAGVGARGERLRPLDAAQATLATCSLGLERALADLRDSPASLTQTEIRARKVLERLSCDVLFRIGWRLLHDEVARPAAAAVARVAERLARVADVPRTRAELERLAATAQTALKEGRPAALVGRLDILSGALADGDFERLVLLTDDLPAWLATDGVTPERFASAAQLRRARSFLGALE